MTDGREANIYTIGHSTHELPTFIRLLQQHDINMLVDIRSYPTSRHVPQFNKVTLGTALKEFHIGYVHLENLGGRRKKCCDLSHNNWWTHPSFRNYADYAETDPKFQHGLNELLELSHNHNVAYMCAESVWWKCHRRIVTDYMIAHGMNVYHIAADGTATKAAINNEAERRGSALVYECR